MSNTMIDVKGNSKNQLDKSNTMNTNNNIYLSKSSLSKNINNKNIL